MVTACKRDNLDIITVIIGADTTKQRTSDTIKLIEYAYKYFDVINVKEIIDNKFKKWLEINESRVYVDKGVKNGVKLYLENLDFEYMAVKKEDIDNIDIKINSIYYLEAPVTKNQIIGNMKILLGKEELGVYNIYSKEEVRKKDINDYLIQFLEVLLNYKFI